MMKKSNEIGVSDTRGLNENQGFVKGIIKSCAYACNNSSGVNFDVKQCQSDVETSLKALDISGGLQSMLAAQMLSIHQLQQQSAALVSRARNNEGIKYFTNTAIKLANCFVQQANALSRLQGNVNQKINVARVDVHSGGQAIVGNVSGSAQPGAAKK